MNRIENAQRRVAKRLPGLHDISYVDCLKFYNIELLELRRIHTDFSYVFQNVEWFNLCEY